MTEANAEPRTIQSPHYTLEYAAREMHAISCIKLPTEMIEKAERHRALSGLAANWLGTYEHAAERLFTRLAARQANAWSEAQWAT